MADNSTLASMTGQSLLVDSSVFESKITEMSKDHLFAGCASEDLDVEMPNIETRVVLVGDAGHNEELLKALETIKVMEVPVVSIRGNGSGKSGEKLIKTIINMEIKVPCIKAESVEEFGDGENAEFETIFILSNFLGHVYDFLHKSDHRILGPPIVLYCTQKGEPLPFNSRPLYCASMLNMVLCFTGFRKKEELVKLVTLAHHMGGTIRRDFSSKVTHLVANTTYGEKFRVAVSMGTPIMKADWIFKAWEKRNELDFCAAAEAFRNEFKVPPFQDCVVSFLGFSDEEKINMEEMTKMQGGQYLPVGDERCTHLVVDENTVKELPFEPSSKLYVVKQEWFWGSIQMDARAGELMYLFEKSDSPTLKKCVSLLSLGTPNSNRKRRRLRETLAQLTRETDISPFPPRKRPSAEHSLSVGSLLDISNTPDSTKTCGGYVLDRIVTRSSYSGSGQANYQHASRYRRKLRKREHSWHRNGIASLRNRRLFDSTTVALAHRVDFKEGCRQTESSNSPFRTSGKERGDQEKDEVHKERVKNHARIECYLGCLALPEKRLPVVQHHRLHRLGHLQWEGVLVIHLTMDNVPLLLFQLFKVPLEKEGQLGGPILAQEEIKTIFGSIPDILEVHTRMKASLEEIMIDWEERKSIGDVILKYSKDLVKTYPPFVNFFEMSKETIVKCEKQKPRFHAFLKINQGKPECGRQSLAELLIRPVQRLPSVALLLNDIKKHTVEDNPDKVILERAIESLKEVMTHINEDKRKTEGQRQIFDVVYEVDGCPANLLSSHRSLVQRVETVALGDDLCDKGEQVTLFLFNDCLEIARKRHKVINTFKSPHGHTRPPASLKHITLMPLSQIKKVLDIQESDECHNAFALVVRPPTEQMNLLFSFQLVAEEPAKEDWLKMLCRHVANTICKADSENLIYTTDADSIEVTTKDMDSTLSRASRAIRKTSKKVTRAFSFSKTPKRVLQRALVANTPDGRSPATIGSSVGSRLASTSSLAGVQSPSLVSLPSLFEKRYHTFSRSTTHLI
nr:PREDICTED: protein ECT2 [Latimeria chalumnae]|eukprot:XP_014346922.1 PREDICTED: protein ECT2 [Latimeria chalumnae]